MIRAIRWGLAIIMAVFMLCLIAKAANSQEVEGESRKFRVTFYCSDRRCTGRHSPQAGGSGLTARGNMPLPFRTAATGDPKLLGSWVYFEDLGGWVYLTDTGQPCDVRPRRLPRSVKKWPCVARNQIDLFIGGPEMHKHALRLGAVEWWGKVHGVE